jgi:hypothetical protein
MVKADVHLRLPHTSILDIYKVFKPLVCCLKGVWVQPYTVIPAKFVGRSTHKCESTGTWEY